MYALAHITIFVYCDLQ